MAHLRSTRETPVDARRSVWQESEGASRPTVELSWPPTAEDLDTVEVITAESCAAPLPIARLDTSLPADVFADTDADLDRFSTEARDDRSDSAPPVAPSSSMRGRQLLLAAASLLVAAVLSQLLTSQPQSGPEHVARLAPESIVVAPTAPLPAESSPATSVEERTPVESTARVPAAGAPEAARVDEPAVAPARNETRPAETPAPAVASTSAAPARPRPEASTASSRPPDTRPTPPLSQTSAGAAAPVPAVRPPAATAAPPPAASASSTTASEPSATLAPRVAPLEARRDASPVTRADASPVPPPASVAPPAAAPPAAVPTPALPSTTTGRTLPGVEAAATRAVPAPAVARSEESQVQAALQRYGTAYTRLDARAAQAVWPSVDARALARAFDSLESQQLQFDRCDLDVAGGVAAAACRGSATYVRRVGSKTPRTEPREWTFRLAKVNEQWQIVSADIR